jgi:hypothetical protein
MVGNIDVDVDVLMVGNMDGDIPIQHFTSIEMLSVILSTF